MLGVDPEIGTSALRLWTAAGSSALFIVAFGLAFIRPMASPALRSGFVAFGAILGAAMTWALLAPAGGDGDAERRAFELRAQELGVQGMAPGSPLACLDALAGEAVEAACEKALFVSPASVASATSYVGARLTLLAGMRAFAEHGGTSIEATLLPLRRSLEADPFGFVAHVLAARDGCSSGDCKALALFGDPNRVRANLKVQLFDQYVERYREAWAKTPDASVAEATQAVPNPQAARRVVDADFPSAASIPPVSIMNPEPSGPILPGVAAAAASGRNGPQAAAPAPRHSRKQASGQSAPPAAPSSASAAAVDPIWPEPLPPPPPQPPQTAAAPVGAAIQLTPPSSGAGARAQ